MILMLIGYAAEDIGESTMHTALSISTCKAKSLCINISGIWTYQSSLIINELSMIQLELFAKMDKQLHKAQGAIFFSTILFGDLLLIILINDFYQFTSISGPLL